MAFSLADKKILLTGGAGFLGQHVKQRLMERGVFEHNIYIPRSRDIDLRTKEGCERAVDGRDVVIHLAAKVGGLWYHVGRGAEFFYENAVMALHLVDAAYRAGVKKFVGLGSTCEYPDDAQIPFREEDVWNGYPTKVTAPYGIAKRVLLMASQTYHEQYNWNAIHLLMINLYGPGDDFNPKSSHAIPAIIRRVDEAKKEGRNFIEVWGDGTASRELLYVDDAAEAIVLAVENYDKPDPINVGSGRETPIKELAELICKLMDFRGTIKWDVSKVGGQHRRMLDTSKAEKEFGFKAKTNLEDGLRNTIEWYNNEYKNRDIK